MSAEDDDSPPIWRGALLLAAFAVVCTTLVAVTHALTEARIEANARDYLSRSFAPVLSSLEYDEVALDSPQVLDAPGELPGDGRALAYLVTRGGERVGLAFAVTTIGYSGPIELLIGVDGSGGITGVRVVRHQETPGLGDKIEATKSDWIHTFRGRSLSDPVVADWNIRDDGGAFDQFTGASVTPRAVVRAVRTTLLYFDKHGSALLNTATYKESSL